MCIFSGPVAAVANTKIFARSLEDGRQVLVYRMQYDASTELAMILPIPTPVAAAEDAVGFIDLSGYEDFFDDMEKGFIEPVSRGNFQPLPQPAGFLSLTVYEVGSFQASFVPTLDDFARLDSRFRLPKQTWDSLPLYRDYGFVVFKLQAGAKNVHPMSFSFPRRNRGELFFPTVHIHDGSVEESAHFDHALYCQMLNPPTGWRTSSDGSSYTGKATAAKTFMDCDKAQGVLDPEGFIHRLHVHGLYKNEDIVLSDQ